MTLPTWISHEPVVWIGLVDAVIILAITFGIHITDDQKAAIDGVLAALGLLLTRSQVTPNAKLTPSGQNIVVPIPPPPAPPAPSEPPA